MKRALKCSFYTSFGWALALLAACHGISLTAQAKIETRVDVSPTPFAFADELTWTSRYTGSINRLRGIASGQGRLVAVGIGGTVLTSDDEVRWEAQSVGSDVNLLDVIYAGAQFVAGGEFGTIMTSPDGIHWTNRASGVPDHLGGIVWAANQFVAVGGGNEENHTREAILTSPDGVSWTLRHYAPSGWLNAVTWNGAQFVAVGSGSLWTSGDGVNWTRRSFGDNYQLRGVASGAGRFVAVGYSRDDFLAAVITSADGETWTRTYTGAGSYLNRAIWTGSHFVVVGEDSLVLTSPDGAGWQTSPILMEYPPDLFGAVADGVRIVVTGQSGWVLTGYQDGVGPLITTPLQSQTVAVGGNAVLSIAAAGTGTLRYQWRCNGIPFGPSSPTVMLTNVQPSHAGIYQVMITDGAGRTASPVASLGVVSTSKVFGDGYELASNILHPNGRVFDQILLTSRAAVITADWNLGQVTRVSFVDLNDDIVQVEFSGPGTLALVLDDPTGPTRPLQYSQAVDYMKGHAGIVITGADERTNLSVFTVGRANAFDPTGAYDFLLPAGPSNDPAKNGSPLFVGHAQTYYDGMANIAYVAISSANGKFGGVRTANARYSASDGITGLYAPGVEFTGPVLLGNINASEAARSVILTGSAADARITGGNLEQSSGRSVLVSGLTQLKFVDGSTSGAVLRRAQRNRGLLEQDGIDVTRKIVVNPTP